MLQPIVVSWCGYSMRVEVARVNRRFIRRAMARLLCIPKFNADFTYARES